MAESVNQLENFTCSICREIYTDPVTVQCGHNHTCCRECLAPVLKQPDARCPDCRGPLHSRSLRSNKNMVQQMKTSSVPCFGCNEKVPLLEMNSHMASCDRIDKSISYFKPVKETTQRVPKNLPNRSTFKCPYCGLANLDINGLRDHCNETHRYDPGHVVCPVCASMPWGDPGQASSDFIAHLNNRHKFDYDTYVDYSQDEQAMLKAALAASLQES